MRNLHSSSYKVINNDYDYDKLMIVAHPDDELIFGGRELLAEKGWKVISITCASPQSSGIYRKSSGDIRKREFIKVMNELECSYEMWDFETFFFNANWKDKLLTINLINAIREKPFKKIITHNLEGEYGHIQHKKLSYLMYNIINYYNLNNFYVFGYNKYQINPYYDEILLLLQNYYSQQSIIKKYMDFILYQQVNKIL